MNQFGYTYSSDQIAYSKEVDSKLCPREWELQGGGSILILV